MKKTEEEKIEFVFANSSIRFFVEELKKFNFNFDDFLLSKKAIKYRFFIPKGQTKEFKELVVRELNINDYPKYQDLYINSTPYFSIEAITVDGFWKHPISFWASLKNQSFELMEREINEIKKSTKLETGKTHNERALEEIQKQKSLQSAFLKSSETLADNMRVKHTQEEELLSNW